MAYSTAAVLVSMISAALAAQQAICPEKTTVEATDAVLIEPPPCLRMSGIA